MDRSTEWPWSWEEEAQWKADLEERNDDFLEELINSALEDSSADSSDLVVPRQEGESVEDPAAEKYSVTA